MRKIHIEKNYTNEQKNMNDICKRFEQSNQLRMDKYAIKQYEMEFEPKKV